MSTDKGPPNWPRRQTLPHEVPLWVPQGEVFFLTINCARRGANRLAVPSMANWLVDTIVARITMGQWYPHVLLLMPDHPHALITFGDEFVMKRVLQSWKRYTARYLGIQWQRDFFDHRIRRDESLSEKWGYILDNPVRAGLVAESAAWPYVWDAHHLAEWGGEGPPDRPVPVRDGEDSGTS